MTEKKHILIVGGGMAGLAAAYELVRNRTAGPPAITLWTDGWRLGGKAASWRESGPEQRSIEHGYHIWSGVYDNASSMMRQVYADANHAGRSRVWTWETAFKPARRIVLFEEYEGERFRWEIPNPTNGLRPGTPGDAGWMRGTDLVLLGAYWVRHRRCPPPPAEGEADDVVPHASLLLRLIAYLVAFAFTMVMPVVLSRLMGAPRRWFLSLVGRILARRGREVAAAPKGSLTMPTRKWWTLVNFAYANVRAADAHRVWSAGFSDLDDLDYNELLERFLVEDGGLTKRSPWSRFIYDAEFAYENGDPLRPRMAAGVAMRTVWSMAFGWRGALVWQMQGGAGEVLFAPLYEWLSDRGVRFEFFNDLEKLEIERSGDGWRVAAATARVTRNLADGHFEYDPLRAFETKNGSVRAFTEKPDESQLEPRAAGATSGRITTARSKKFDAFILAVPLRVVERVAATMDRAFDGWDQLLTNPTLTTQAAQVWFHETPVVLGLSDGDDPLLASHPGTRLGVLGDVSRLLELEPPQSSMGALLYACGPHQLGTGHDIHHLLSGFKIDLHPGLPTAVPAHIHTHLNDTPSSQFTQCLPGVPGRRRRPDASGLDNLAFAGDWTATGLDLSNLEASTLSGRIAARWALRLPIDDLPFPRDGAYASELRYRKRPRGREPAFALAVLLMGMLLIAAPTVLALSIPNVMPTEVPRCPHVGHCEPMDTVAPWGYTASLSLFAVPCIGLFFWGLSEGLYRREWRAIGIVTASVFVMGLMLDEVLAGVLFDYPNHGSVMGLWIPGFTLDDPLRASWYPFEELLFYGLGGNLMVMLYVFGDTSLYARYRDVAAERTPVRLTRSRLLVRVAGMVVGLFVSLWLLKLLGRWYFVDWNCKPPLYLWFLCSIGVAGPSIVVGEVFRLVNWRAYFPAFLTVLFISLLWEVTLGVPYGYWRYSQEYMLGIEFSPWYDLPAEAVLMWLVSSFAVVLLYESLLHASTVAADAELTGPTDASQG